MVKTEEKKKVEKKQKPSVFAVIETGGKQYKVSEGDMVKVEKISGEYKEGDKIVFDSVLLMDDGAEIKVGEPNIEKAKVTGELIEEGRDKKIAVTRYRSKSRYFKNKGHRQPYFKVKIVSISGK